MAVAPVTYSLQKTVTGRRFQENPNTDFLGAMALFALMLNSTNEINLIGDAS